MQYTLLRVNITRKLFYLCTLVWMIILYEIRYTCCIILVEMNKLSLIAFYSVAHPCYPLASLILAVYFPHTN